MSRNEVRNERRPNGSEFVGMPCCPEGVACATWFRRHRLAAYAACIVAALGFLALQVAWILGAIAFFRTL